MQTLKQSDPRAAHRRIYFTCVDTAALQTRLQASDMSTFVVYLGKNGAAAVLNAAVPVEEDATHEKGQFYVELAVADIATDGMATLTVTNTGGTKTMEKREILFEVEQAFFATVVSGLSTTSFTTNRAEATNDYWKNAYASVLTGALAGQVAKIASYTGSSKLVTLASPFTDVLGTGDFVELINR